jgi:hypothetical protein
MSQWHVELVCESQELLAFLSTALQEPVCTVKAGSTDSYICYPDDEPRLAARKASGYYLLSSEFESLTDAGEIRHRAIEMLPLLNALVKLKISAFALPLAIDGVYRLDAKGQFIWELGSVTVKISTHANMDQNATGQALNFTQIWQLAQKHAAVDEALRHLVNETNWFNLYKVYEIIKHDVGKKTLATWTQGENDDFTYSANNGHASRYAARHASLKYGPSKKRKTMSLAEAAAFITHVFLQWLQTK